MKSSPLARLMLAACLATLALLGQAKEAALVSLDPALDARVVAEEVDALVAGRQDGDEAVVEPVAPPLALAGVLAASGRDDGHRRAGHGHDQAVRGGGCQRLHCQTFQCRDRAQGARRCGAACGWAGAI